jgi:hypothetical protein
MANDEHVAILKKGVDAWNAWRDENPDIRPDLSGADLHEANLRMANLIEANLSRADLDTANLRGADLRRADFREADVREADLRGADLSEANLRWAYLWRADLSKADLSGANLGKATLLQARLYDAKLGGADLSNASVIGANFGGADLSGARLEHASLADTDFMGADLTGCRVYGVSAWGLKLERAKQQNLVITRFDEPEITVDNIEIAQFVYLLLHNEKIRDVIDTIGKKGVLLLGRFTEGRMVVLERLREKLRDLGYVPMVFNFDKPETKASARRSGCWLVCPSSSLSTSPTLGRLRLNYRRPCRTTWSRSPPSSRTESNPSPCS